MNRPIVSLLLPLAGALLLFTFSRGEQDAGDAFPVLTGPYLGQAPPGREPVLFAPGILCTGMNERDVTFSPAGDELYFGLRAGSVTTIVVSRIVEGRWSEPEIAPFASGRDVMDIEPHITPDGSRLLFFSSRPPAGAEPGEGLAHRNLWAMERTEDGWGVPYDLGAPINGEGGDYCPATTREGTLYYCRSAPGNPRHTIWRARLEDGRYVDPEELPEAVNCAPTQFNSFISPDEDWLVVCMGGMPDMIGPADYYITFRSEEDEWTAPINMGERFNHPRSAARSVSLSPDGSYLFFSSCKPLDEREGERTAFTWAALREAQSRPGNGSYDIYWVDAAVIESLRPPR